MSELIDIHGREVLDSRGNPTVEAEVALESGFTGPPARDEGLSDRAKRGDSGTPCQLLGADCARVAVNPLTCLKLQFRKTR